MAGNGRWRAGNVFIANVGSGSIKGSVVEIPRGGTSQPQTITFNPIGIQTLGVPLTLSATASSGLTVVFTTTTPTVCSVSGTTVSLAASGVCTIVASQVGNSAYAAATPIEQSFSVLGSGQVLGVSFAVPSGVTLGTPIVFTEGVPSSSLASPDFTLASSGNTCTGAVSGTCSLNVQFTPQQPGLRRGAVKLVDNNNNVLATYFISGIGPNSLPAWTPGVPKTLYNKGFVRGVTVDGAGNVFFVEISANQIYKVTPGGVTTAVPLGLTMNSPYGLALDAAGDLFIADAGNNRVLELPYGSSNATVLNITGLVFPEGLAVDGAGNLFIANTRASAVAGSGNIIELAAGTRTQTTLIGSGLNFPSGVAVDASGDVFIADKYNDRILEIPASGSPVAIGANLSGASAVGIDAAGDVFITDSGHNQLVEVPGTSGGPGTGTQTIVGTGLLTPYAMALDGQGDVFIANVGSGSTKGSIIEIPMSTTSTSR